MSKSIPVALQTHYDTLVTTTAFLMRIERNVGAEGTPLAAVGICSLDRDIAYNDGDGSVTYSALAGFIPSALLMTGDLSVDPSEIESAIPAADLGPMVESEINAGLYDGALFKLYRVNYNDLTTGRHELMRSGTIGKARTWNGLSVFLETREKSQKLKQNACDLDSITCRATFGDAQCGFDFSGEWVAGSVTSVGSETDRVFTDTAIAQADGYYIPGVIEWLTGDNVGRTFEIESQVADVISLRFPVPYTIQTGDTYRRRRDCGKRFEEDCIAVWANGDNFRGEPYIPLGDEAQMATGIRPGANAGTDSDNIFSDPV